MFTKNRFFFLNLNAVCNQTVARTFGDIIFREKNKNKRDKEMLIIERGKARKFP